MMKDFATQLISAFNAHLIEEGELFDAFLDLTNKQCHFRMQQDNLDITERKKEIEIDEQIATLKAFIKERNGRLK